ncbi:GlsB/YeaQ/YmgE family stress response membrane protein [Actinomycetospora sp. NBC_00405]|uniref:GlsB/YeaQ/YmgE family stress response membrane protein n=1 Tax=Actinomycetospora sp. NBC_00405 TaxID=2975952 RepID=UPI002E2379FD
MTITGIISAIVIGLVIGVLARAILPGKQRIPIWMTIVAGIVAALIGTFLARALGIATVTGGIDWLELLVQLVVALVVVAAVAGVAGRRGVRR